MNFGDVYGHYSGVEYQFFGIALPLSKHKIDKVKYLGKVRYHEDTHDISLYILDDVLFVNYVLPCAIYQSEKDYGTNKRYAREIDDFFGYVRRNDGTYIKRFALKSDL